MSKMRSRKMSYWSWKEGFSFALARKLLAAEGTYLTYQMNLSEKWGSQILQPLYISIEFISKNIRMPLAICLFTLLAALILGFTFYSIPAFIIFGKLFPVWLIRLLFFCYIELNLLAMGCVAFGRFNNNALIDLWKSGRLVAFIPGDYEK